VHEEHEEKKDFCNTVIPQGSLQLLETAAPTTAKILTE
jgi:hypothetical protein